LTVVSLPALPFPASKLAGKINAKLWKKKLSFVKNPILWASLPTAVSAIGSLNESKVIYYCGDDFGSLAGVDHAPVLKLEQQLVVKSDLVFAASDFLTAKFSASKTHHLPHGVDYKLFSTPDERAKDLPLGKPIAGFYGSISDWVDVDLMAETASKMPHWNFVFVGEKRTDLSKLEALSNVFFLGERPHSALPSYVQHWQVSLLPFKDNAQIRACNPLKLREYMAAGTPIVSTNFPALKPYLSLIHVGQDFTALLDNALMDTRNSARKHLVQDESWEARAATIHKLLQETA
jgi:glycosyltransferase involved in cell wall biosynthesis